MTRVTAAMLTKTKRGVFATPSRRCLHAGPIPAPRHGREFGGVCLCRRSKPGLCCGSRLPGSDHPNGPGDHRKKRPAHFHLARQIDAVHDAKSWRRIICWSWPVRQLSGPTTNKSQLKQDPRMRRGQAHWSLAIGPKMVLARLANPTQPAPLR